MVVGLCNGSIFGEGGILGFVGGSSVFFLRVLLEYQKTPTIGGGLSLCFVVDKIAFLSEENSVADGVVLGGTLVALLDV